MVAERDTDMDTYLREIRKLSFQAPEVRSVVERVTKANIGWGRARLPVLETLCLETVRVSQGAMKRPNIFYCCNSLLAVELPSGHVLPNDYLAISESLESLVKQGYLEYFGCGCMTLTNVALDLHQSSIPPNKKPGEYERAVHRSYSKDSSWKESDD